MPSATTEGIVLSRRLSGDSDFICSIYTKDSGKQQFIFKGLKKTRKRPISASEPGSVITLTYNCRENSTIHTVSSFEPIQLNHGIRSSTSRIFSLYYMMELIDRTSGHGDAIGKLFPLTAAALNTLETTGYVMHFTLFFTLHYMSLLGILPETGRCAYCGTEVSDSWEVENFTLRFICAGCSDYSLHDISGNTSNFIRNAAGSRFTSFDLAMIRPDETAFFFRKVTGYIENYFGFRFKTADILLDDFTASHKKNSQNP